MRARTAALLVAGLAGSAAAGTEPVPFRLDDALAGRGFQYNAESFLHRWAYRLHFPLLDAPAPGFVGSAGSVRASEFVVDMSVSQTVALGALGEFGFRWRRNEDFDGRWDEVLVGLSRPLGEHWRISLWGDVPADKEDLDVRFELAWTDPGRRSFRVAFIATDFQYNAKQVLAEYTRLPYALFLEHGITGLAGGELYAFADLGLRTRWQDLVGGLTLDDERARYGLAWRSAAAAEPHWSLAVESERADRHWRAVTRDDGLARRFLAVTLERRLGRADGSPLWFGVRGLRLDETWTHAAPTAADLIRRREVLAYLGTAWQARADLTLRPELVLSALRNLDDLGDAGDARRRAVLGKLSLAMEWTIAGVPDARVVVMPSLKLHEFQFGGAAVQLHVPF